MSSLHADRIAEPSLAARTKSIERGARLEPRLVIVIKQKEKQIKRASK